MVIVFVCDFYGLLVYPIMLALLIWFFSFCICDYIWLHSLLYF